jgi:hypothetical protein
MTQDSIDVLNDLRMFCRAYLKEGSTFDTDPLQMARNCGRQEVFNRIIDFITNDEADYTAHYKLNF